jgi:hypothetical protein
MKMFDFYFHLKKLLLTIFTNHFLTTLLGIFPHEIGKKIVFSLELGPIFGSKKRRRKITESTLNPFSEFLPNLYYSPIKKVENIFIFKIVSQKRP